ncbi:NADP-dependent oxidoreductase domain-containing protein [Lipomyces oligophaga]|uniref:NADP-dependent oxidoreductase domain-containing protein n=1 Tax=Lipomyces oligophaga TaxID=45792 RepID=UPI0034CD174B
MAPPQLHLGKNGPLVSAIGFGAMGMSAFYGTKDRLSDQECFQVFDKALELGVTFFDTARIYGSNEDLIGRWLKTSGKRDQIFLATKWGVHPDTFKSDGTAEYCKASIEESLTKLGVPYVDLFYQHRIDTTTPIEHSVRAMAELVKEGKVKHIGLSECSAATLRRAHKVHPITAIQIEFSPFALDAEHNGLMAAAKELGVAVVAYSPLSRGFLTGAIRSPDDLPPNDFRRSSPRFSAENFPANLKLLDQLQEIADKKGISIGQLTLAWEISEGAFPIPGTTKISRLEENVAGAEVKLTDEEVAVVTKFIESAEIKGDRYPNMTGLYADTPELTD